MFSFNKKKMISINFEGGDGIKNPKLFYKDPRYNGYKVQGNLITQNDSIVSFPNNKNNNNGYFKSGIKNYDLYSLNNFEISIKFKSYNPSSIYTSGRLLQYGNHSKNFCIKLNAENPTSNVWVNYINIHVSEYPYVDINFDRFSGMTANVWNRFVLTFRKGSSISVEVYNDETNALLFSKTLAETRWIGAIPNTSDQVDFGAANTEYALGQYDLSKTWIKDLDTNEILVPWLD